MAQAEQLSTHQQSSTNPQSQPPIESADLFETESGDGIQSPFHQKTHETLTHDPFLRFKQSYQSTTQPNLSNFFVNNQIEARQQLLNYSAVEKTKLKERNLQKFQIKTDSPLYYFHVKHLQQILYRYPQEFPKEVISEVKRGARWQRWKMNAILTNVAVVVISYLRCRTKNWYILTGRKYFAPLYYVLGNFYLVAQYQFYTQSMQKNVFTHNKYFEEVIRKHNIGPKNFFF